MDLTVLLVLLITSWPFVSALFTVEAEYRIYEAEFRGNAVLGCAFQPVPRNLYPAPTVIWQRLTPPAEVYRMDNGVENLQHQDPRYRGRVRLLEEQLKDGWARLQVSNLRINDSGIYQCLVQIGVADYKTMTLSVRAPYKSVTKSIQKSTEGDEVVLTCKSEGYPASSVTWKDGNLGELGSNSTVVRTPDQLFEVTSQIRVRSSEKNNYTCNFTNGDFSATFNIPDEIPKPEARNDALIIALGTTVVVVVIVTVVVLRHRARNREKAPRRNGMTSARNPLVCFQGHSDAVACLQINKQREEEKPVSTESVKGLGEFLKSHYRKLSLDKEVRQHRDTFCQEDLKQRLQNSDGCPLNLQALLPKAGDTRLLEGPPGSGKTTIAKTLISSWTEGPTHDLYNQLELSILHLLFSVDCSKMKGDLFHEIMSQLCLGARISTEEDLRTRLSGSTEALLLLDDYKEGNQVLDESLMRFLREKKGCRVLVMACPGHCPRLKEMVGPQGLLKLQM